MHICNSDMTVELSSYAYAPPSAADPYQSLKYEARLLLQENAAYSQESALSSYPIVQSFTSYKDESLLYTSKKNYSNIHQMRDLSPDCGFPNNASSKKALTVKCSADVNNEDLDRSTDFRSCSSDQSSGCETLPLFKIISLHSSVAASIQNVSSSPSPSSSLHIDYDHCITSFVLGSKMIILANRQGNVVVLDLNGVFITSLPTDSLQLKKSKPLSSLSSASVASNSLKNNNAYSRHSSQVSESLVKKEIYGKENSAPIVNCRRNTDSVLSVNKQSSSMEKSRAHSTSVFDWMKRYMNKKDDIGTRDRGRNFHDQRIRSRSSSPFIQGDQQPYATFSSRQSFLPIKATPYKNPCPLPSHPYDVPIQSNRRQTSPSLLYAVGLLNNASEHRSSISSLQMSSFDFREEDEEHSNLDEDGIVRVNDIFEPPSLDLYFQNDDNQSIMSSKNANGNRYSYPDSAALDSLNTDHTNSIASHPASEVLFSYIENVEFITSIAMDSSENVILLGTNLGKLFLWKWKTTHVTSFGNFVNERTKKPVTITAVALPDINDGRNEDFPDYIYFGVSTGQVYKRSISVLSSFSDTLLYTSGPSPLYQFIHTSSDASNESGFCAEIRDMRVAGLYIFFSLHDFTLVYHEKKQRLICRFQRSAPSGGYMLTGETSVNSAYYHDRVPELSIFTSLAPSSGKANGHVAPYSSSSPFFSNSPPSDRAYRDNYSSRRPSLTSRHHSASKKSACHHMKMRLFNGKFYVAWQHDLYIYLIPTQSNIGSRKKNEKFDWTLLAQERFPFPILDFSFLDADKIIVVLLVHPSYVEGSASHLAGLCYTQPFYTTHHEGGIWNHLNRQPIQEDSDIQSAYYYPLLPCCPLRYIDYTLPYSLIISVMGQGNVSSPSLSSNIPIDECISFTNIATQTLHVNVEAYGHWIGLETTYSSHLTSLTWKNFNEPSSASIDDSVEYMPSPNLSFKTVNQPFNAYFIFQKNVILFRPLYLEENLIWLMQRERYSECLSLVVKEDEMYPLLIADDYVRQLWKQEAYEQAIHVLSEYILPTAGASYWQALADRLISMKKLRLLEPYLPFDQRDFLSASTYLILLNDYVAEGQFEDLYNRIARWPIVYPLHELCRCLEIRLQSTLSDKDRYFIRLCLFKLYDFENDYLLALRFIARIDPRQALDYAQMHSILPMAFVPINSILNRNGPFRRISGIFIHKKASLTLVRRRSYSVTAKGLEIMNNNNITSKIDSGDLYHFMHQISLLGNLCRSKCLGSSSYVKVDPSLLLSSNSSLSAFSSSVISNSSSDSYLEQLHLRPASQSPLQIILSSLVMTPTMQKWMLCLLHLEPSLLRESLKMIGNEPDATSSK